eukprot:6379519-Alexandrium_andersonii.AAC.1
MHGLARPECPCQSPANGRAGGRQARVRGGDPSGVHDPTVSGSAGARRPFPPRASGLGIVMAGASASVGGGGRLVRKPMRWASSPPRS